MKKALFILVLAVGVLTSASAHFLVIYTPDTLVEGSEVTFKVVFTHPFNAGHTMDMGKNAQGEVMGFEEFLVVHKGETMDLAWELEEITFASLENSGVAYDFTLSRDNGFRGGGDWVIVGVPAPYYEESEDIYIQQITKTMVNKGDIATDWSDRVADGYPEIIPYVKPYAVWQGGMFRGKVVDGKGNPVPRAEIEVEFINYDVDMDANKFTGNPKIQKEGHGAAVILADLQGDFEFIPPKAGFWGFAALGAGGEMMHDGRELSQDAVLWIEAKSLEDDGGSGTAAAQAADEEDTEEAAARPEERKISIALIVIIALAVVIIIVVVILVAVKSKKKKKNSKEE
jgi:cobalt/nickel transport protein